MKPHFHGYDQVVYFLQGGGALGAYQVGVCEGLLNNGFTPDWLIGTSIGAINASIIAGNKPKHRINKLKEFWNHISSTIPAFPIASNNEYIEKAQNFYIAQYVAQFGLPGFFKPRWFNPWFIFSGTPDQLSYYDTSELYDTLTKVIDFDLINQKKIRLTLGAVQIKNGKDVRFDNFHQDIDPRHIMASAALPPGFPAIKIDDHYYWDGGVSSNTPFAVLLEEQITARLLCIIVNLFSLTNQLPTSMMEILKEKKEFEYASRHQEILHHFLELHLLQQTIDVLTPKKITPELDAILKKVALIGHPSFLNILRFHYNDKPSNLVSSDFNFHPAIIKQHWQSGADDIQKALQNQSIWLDQDEGNTGAIFHEF